MNETRVPYCEITDETAEQERARVIVERGEIAVRRLEQDGFRFTGARMFMCGSARPEDICKRCGRLSDVLCDWPEGGRTCDLPLCRGCAASIGEDVDLCPVHAVAFGKLGRMP